VRGAEGTFRIMSRLRAKVSAVTLLAAAGLCLMPAGAEASTVRKPEPKFVAPDLRKLPKGTRVDVIADRLTYDGRTKIATATGMVRLTYGPYILTATKVVYDMKRKRFRANGSIELREPNGNIMQADSADLAETFKEGFANHVKALLNNDVVITSRYAKRFENGITIYEDASYTACKACIDAGGKPVWQIIASQAKHDLDTHTLYYKNAHLEIGGVPVAWTPYFSYPDPTVKRRTGFLLPAFHGGEAYGLGVTTPYFYEVAPNADFTLSPMWNTRQGVLGDLEWRHRTASGSYKIRGYGIYETDPNIKANGPWRGALESKGKFRLSDAWSWGWDGTVASDRDFLSDYDISGGSILTSSVNTTGLSGRNYANAQLIHYQTQADGESQDLMPVVLPYVTANYVFDQPVLGGEVTFDMNAYSLRRLDPDPRFTLGTEQSHAVTRVKWQRQMTSEAGLVITPFAELRSDLYVSENVAGPATGQTTDTFFLPSAGVDMRWPLIADHGVAQGVLTPVFQVVAAPSEPNRTNTGAEDAITLNFDSTNLFLSDRFTGFDRYEGGVRANAGVTYSLLGENGGFIRASLGESFHMAGQNSFAAGSGLDGTSSDLVAALALQLNEAAGRRGPVAHQRPGGQPWPHFRQDFRVCELCGYCGRRQLWAAHRGRTGLGRCKLYAQRFLESVR
jgi:LPS-assembly protein